jgi:ABC-type polysaccharide/polyol phosphate transport system ATPase subunit
MARVVLENVRVDFPIYATQRNLRSAIVNRATGGLIRHQGRNQNRVVVTALSGVSMTLEDGDRLGLIGHNGSGKSTLLKVIAGIYEPIEGRLMVEGTVTPLFDMMPGLDPEDSGYENIITTGLLLGLSRNKIESIIPDVEEFSELGEYLALPVRTYSTGMQMRLGFALLTALDPGVLLMDEVIGAGDARFAERAETRLNDFVGRSRIVVLASHSPALIRSICNKGALLQSGQLVALGPLEDVFDEYHALAHGRSALVNAPAQPSHLDAPAQSDDAGNTVASGSSEVLEQENAPSVAADLDERQTESGGEPVWPMPKFIADATLQSEFAACLGGSVETLDGVLCERPQIHLPFSVSLRYRLLKDSQLIFVPSFHFLDAQKRPFFVSTPSELPPNSRGAYVVRCRVDPFVLNTGRYWMGLALASVELTQPIHFHAHCALGFEIYEPHGVDPRRHGYDGEFPGTSRARLEWHFAKLPCPEHQ